MNVDVTSGAVSWTPDTAGSYEVIVKATNAAGSDTFTFTVDVTSTPPAPPVASFTMTPGAGDAPLQVAFDSSASTAPGGFLSTIFSFGDQTPDKEGKTATHTYNTCGGYQARLRVIDAYGQVGLSERSVAVTCNGKRPPSARIAAVVIESPGKTSVAFNADCKPGSGAIVAYQWSTTDGYFSDEQSGTHDFAPGMHTLRLTVIDENGLIAADDMPVFAFAGDGRKPPQITARATPAAATAPAAVKFTLEALDPDGQVASVKWRFSDGSEVSEREPSRTYNDPIADEVKVEVTDNDGLVATATVSVTIRASDNSLPPRFVSVPTEELIAGQVYAYDEDGLPTVSGSGPFQYDLLLAPEGATVDSATGKLSYTAPYGPQGPKEFSLRVVGAAGSAVQNWEVSVIDLGVPAPDDGNASGGCGCHGGGAGMPFVIAAALWFARRRRNRQAEG